MMLLCCVFSQATFVCGDQLTVSIQRFRLLKKGLVCGINF